METFARICSCFRRAGRPIMDLGATGPGGCVAVIAEGARVAALAFAPDEESVLFANPELERIAGEGVSPVDLRGGPGGDRIRFAPEYAYAWIGTERDLHAFSNYRVQEQEDPGGYRLEPVTGSGGRAVRLAAEPSLVDRRDGGIVRFSVERTVALAPLPLPGLPAGVRYAGYQSRSTVSLLEVSGGSPGGKCVGLWHLLQVPAGSTLLLPLNGPVPPVRYFNTGGWQLHDGVSSSYLSWQYEGKANAKIGYGCAQVTGRVGALRRRSEGEWVLVILEFPVHRGMHYCDAVSPETAGDQVFQAWDGFGFGELEYHGPAVGGPPLPARWEEQAQVWAFGGPSDRIEALARHLLGIEGGME